MGARSRAEIGPTVAERPASACELSDERGPQRPTESSPDGARRRNRVEMLRFTPLLESTSCGNRPVRRANLFRKLRATALSSDLHVALLHAHFMRGFSLARKTPGCSLYDLAFSRSGCSNDRNVMNLVLLSYSRSRSRSHFRRWQKD